MLLQHVQILKLFMMFSQINHSSNYCNLFVQFVVSDELGWGTVWHGCGEGKGCREQQEESVR